MHRCDSRRCPPAESRLSGPAGQAPEPSSACGGREQEHRLKVLFQVLDVNGDGGICVNDLTIGLKKLGVHRTEHELLVSEERLCLHTTGTLEEHQQPPAPSCVFVRTSSESVSVNVQSASEGQVEGPRLQPAAVCQQSGC